MGFTRFTTNVSAHQALGDTPNADDGLTAEQLKQRFDKPVEDTKEALNGLMAELENSTDGSEGASSIGASALFVGDTSNSNVQAKLEKLQDESDNLKAGGLTDGTIVTSKLADDSVKTAKINDNAVTNSKIVDNAITTDKINNSAITTDKINDGAVTSAKLDSNAKKAENLSATSIGAGDTYSANIQAKLNGLQEQITGVSQGGVADNSIGTNKIINGAVTANKLASALSLFLVPSGLISMWSGVSIPSGWNLCDGTNGTPDLRDRFIVGAGSAYDIGDVGGENSHVLTIGEMPEHSHDLSSLGNLGLSIGTSYGDRMYAGTSDLSPENTSMNQRSLGSGSTDNNGGGQAHENRPPYYALAYIMKA